MNYIVRPDKAAADQAKYCRTEQADKENEQIHGTKGAHDGLSATGVALLVGDIGHEPARYQIDFICSPTHVHEIEQVVVSTDEPGYYTNHAERKDENAGDACILPDRYCHVGLPLCVRRLAGNYADPDNRGADWLIGVLSGRCAVGSMVVAQRRIPARSLLERSYFTTRVPERSCSRYLPLPIRVTLVPQVGQTPCIAGRPFLSVVGLGSLISTIMRSLTQYA